MAKQLCKFCFCAVVLLGFAQKASSQVNNWKSVNLGWTLYSANGNLILTRDGKRTVFQNGSSGAQGVLLGAKDMVQTGKGTAELHLQNASGISASNASLKLSENTSVILEKIEGGVELELLYGRMAVLSNSALSVRTGNALISFKECDATLDYTARPGVTNPSLSIRCFGGEGEVSGLPLSEAEGAAFPIKEGESLSLEYRTPFTYVERQSLGSNTEPGQTESYNRDWVSAGDIGDNSNSIKTGNIVMGILLVGAGAAMQGYNYIANPRPELRDRLFYGSCGALGLGTVFLLGAAIYRTPQRPAYR